jgi:hypothetical protein
MNCEQSQGVSGLFVNNLSVSNEGFLLKIYTMGGIEMLFFFMNSIFSPATKDRW